MLNEDQKILLPAVGHVTLGVVALILACFRLGQLQLRCVIQLSRANM